MTIDRNFKIKTIGCSINIYLYPKRLHTCLSLFISEAASNIPVFNTAIYADQTRSLLPRCQWFDTLHNVLSLPTRWGSIINGVDGDGYAAILDDICLSLQLAIAVNTLIYSSRVGFDVGPGKGSLLLVPNSFVDMRITCHACLDKLDVLIVLAVQLGNVDVQSIAKGQEGSALGDAVDDSIDYLNANLGGPGSWIGLVVDVKVGNLLIACGYRDCRHTAFRCGVPKCRELATPNSNHVYLVTKVLE